MGNESSKSRASAAQYDAVATVNRFAIPPQLLRRDRTPEDNKEDSRFFLRCDPLLKCVLAVSSDWCCVFGSPDSAVDSIRLPFAPAVVEPVVGRGLVVLAGPNEKDSKSNASKVKASASRVVVFDLVRREVVLDLDMANLLPKEGAVTSLHAPPGSRLCFIGDSSGSVRVLRLRAVMREQRHEQSKGANGKERRDADTHGKKGDDVAAGKKTDKRAKAADLPEKEGADDQEQEQEQEVQERLRHTGPALSTQYDVSFFDVFPLLRRQLKSDNDRERALASGEYTVVSLEVCPANDELLLIAFRGGVCAIWNLPERKVAKHLRFEARGSPSDPSDITTACWAPDACSVAVGFRDGRVCVYGIDNHRKDWVVAGAEVAPPLPGADDGSEEGRDAHLGISQLLPVRALRAVQLPARATTRARELGGRKGSVGCLLVLGGTQRGLESESVLCIANAFNVGHAHLLEDSNENSPPGGKARAARDWSETTYLSPPCDVTILDFALFSDVPFVGRTCMEQCAVLMFGAPVSTADVGTQKIACFYGVELFGMQQLACRKLQKKEISDTAILGSDSSTADELPLLISPALHLPPVFLAQQSPVLTAAAASLVVGDAFMQVFSEPIPYAQEQATSACSAATDRETIRITMLPPRSDLWQNWPGTIANKVDAASSSGCIVAFAHASGHVRLWRLESQPASPFRSTGRASLLVTLHFARYVKSVAMPLYAAYLTLLPGPRLLVGFTHGGVVCVQFSRRSLDADPCADTLSFIESDADEENEVKYGVRDLAGTETVEVHVDSSAQSQSDNALRLDVVFALQLSDIVVCSAVSGFALSDDARDDTTYGVLALASKNNLVLLFRQVLRSSKIALWYAHKLKTNVLVSRLMFASIPVGPQDSIDHASEPRSTCLCVFRDGMVAALDLMSLQTSVALDAASASAHASGSVFQRESTLLSRTISKIGDNGQQTEYFPTLLALLLDADGNPVEDNVTLSEMAERDKTALIEPTPGAPRSLCIVTSAEMRMYELSFAVSQERLILDPPVRFSVLFPHQKGRRAYSIVVLRQDKTWGLLIQDAHGAAVVLSTHVLSSIGLRLLDFDGTAELLVPSDTGSTAVAVSQGGIAMSSWDVAMPVLGDPTTSDEGEKLNCTPVWFSVVDFPSKKFDGGAAGKSQKKPGFWATLTRSDIETAQGSAVERVAQSGARRTTDDFENELFEGRRKTGGRSGNANGKPDDKVVQAQGEMEGSNAALGRAKAGLERNKQLLEGLDERTEEMKRNASAFSAGASALAAQSEKRSKFFGIF